MNSQFLIERNEDTQYKRKRPVLPMQTGIGLHLNRDGPNPKQLKAACRENSMNTKTLKAIKRHVAALPIQTGKSRGWSSNGSGDCCEVLGSAWGLYAAAGGVARDSWRMQKKSGWTNEYDGLDDRGSSGPIARCPDSMKAHPISTILGICFLCGGDAAFADDLDRPGLRHEAIWGPIDWKSRKQVTTSTTEAELLAPSRAAQETYWWKRLFNAVDFNLNLTTIFTSLAITNQLSIL